jgi:nitrogen fixation NifU-like protein
MSELQDLYQQVILDHNNNPRNFGELKDASHHSEGLNPLCGDHIYIDLKLDGDVIKEVAFHGDGCAISKASSSVMTTLLIGKTKQQAMEMFDRFHDLVTSDAEVDVATDGKMAVFAGVRVFPARVKCASLAWHAMKTAIEGGEVVSTE